MLLCPRKWGWGCHLPQHIGLFIYNRMKFDPEECCDQRDREREKERDREKELKIEPTTMHLQRIFRIALHLSTSPLDFHTKKKNPTTTNSSSSAFLAYSGCRAIYRRRSRNSALPEFHWFSESFHWLDEPFAVFFGHRFRPALYFRCRILAHSSTPPMIGYAASQ